MIGIVERIQSALGDRYQIERELGRGGMATVYLAIDLKHNRRVALKILHPNLTTNLGTERFLREIRTAASLQHPHILTVHDSGEADGLLYYVMPYVEGESLRVRLRRERQLSLDDSISIAREVAEALSFAHARGIVHRDVKPENVLMSGQHACIADFGIARALDAAGAEALTTSGSAIGTPAYMSPEQASGETKLDARSDIYSLGCVLYEMLGGEIPHYGATPQAVLSKRLTEPPPSVRSLRDTVPERIERALKRALARAPADRYATAQEFADVLAAQPRDSGTSGISGARPTGWLRRSRLRRSAFLGLGASAIALSAVLAILLWGPDRRGAEERSIAVLPFDNDNSDGEAGYFAEGMTDEIRSALTQVQGLRVLPRTSLPAALAGLTADKQGSALGVEVVLRGTVRRASDRLWISAELVNVTNNDLISSTSFQRTISDMSDVGTIKERMARWTAGSLKLKLSDEGRVALTRPGTADLDAYDLYLEGRSHWNRRTVPELRMAAELFTKALQRDPEYALAYAGLADCYVLLGSPEYPGMQPAEAFQKAKVAALRAISIDSSLAEAHASLANVYQNHEWNWTLAEREFERAIQLNPNYSTAHQWYGYLLAALRRNTEALVQMELARRLDPLSPIPHTGFGRILYWGRDYQRSVTSYQAGLAMDSAFVTASLGIAFPYQGLGRYKEAIDAIERARTLTGGRHPAVVPILASLYAAAGQRDTALAFVRSLAGQKSGRIVPPEFIALVHLSLGERKEAMTALERAFAARSPIMVSLQVEPVLDPLRTDPKFIAMVAAMRFP
ncbi:MAG: protein kinase [Anaerolineae bacterium]|nr:protein kinase [Gemmatimonadaceae bacterium]